MSKLNIGPQTTVHALLETYPDLLDFLVGYNPKFSLLRNAAMRATMGRIATLEQAAGMAGIPVEKLVNDILDHVAGQTGEAAPPMAGGADAHGPDPVKVEMLKSIIRKLHAGEDVQAAREEFARLLSRIEPEEIAAMEQSLIRDGMPVGEIHRLCDLHVNVFREGLDTQEEAQTPPGHPLHTYMAENSAIMKAADRWVELCLNAGVPLSPAVAEEMQEALQRLGAVEKHYARKENQLFPYLEKHGFTGPSQVMWALHDDIRRLLKALRAAIDAGDVPALLKDGPEAARMISEMIFKERKILFPTALRMLSESEWRQIRAGDDEIGYALIPDPPRWDAEGAGTEPRAPAGAQGLIQLSTGELTQQQLDRLLLSMPVEFSFVDENDEVRYYSGHADRIFPRSPAVIGRKVQNCHPPHSVHMVNAILEAFKAGTKDHAAFWLTIKDRFVHIAYYPVRDESGCYLGTLEVTQDITGIRKLEGEQRLLDWEI